MAIRINGDNTTAAPGITSGADTDTGVQFGTDELQFVTGGTNRATVESNGDLTIEDGNLVFASGHGIDFSATGDNDNGTLGNELFDDYEEGTFTPIIRGGTTAGTFTPNQYNGGIYTKIGNIVHCQINAQGSLTGATGDPQVAGLPYLVADGGAGPSGNAAYSTGSMQYWNNSGADLMGPLTNKNSHHAYFHSYDGDSSGNATINNHSNHNLHCSVTYRVG